MGTARLHGCGFPGTGATAYARGAMSTALTSGSVVAGLTIVRPIGQGAGGTVYLATDAAGGRVALKVPAPELARDDRFRRRFLREAEIAAALDEPHVVPTVAFGEDAGTLYLAMAYIDGPDLREILKREGPLAPERAVGLVAQVASALDAAHARGLVHRDVKPGNVLVTTTEAGEHADLCDFGLAKHISSVTSLTGDRSLVGTIAYISPEQIEGSAIDARADVYSLGCMLFECLTGEAPFARESELAAVYAHMNEAPPLASDLRPDLPAAFDEVIATAMAKSPADRFPSCGALASAAASALRGRAPSRRARAGRRRSLWALAGLAAVAVAAVVGVLALRGGGDGGATQARLDIPPKSLGLIDARSHRVVDTVSFASQPWDVAFGPGTAWALLGDEGRVARVDVASRKVLSTTALPFAPGGIATGGGGAWVTEDRGDGLVRLDGATGAIRRRYSIPARGDRGDLTAAATGVAYGAGSVWLARGSETLRIEPRTGAVQHRFFTPLAPTSVVFAGGEVWVASAENGRIVRIDPATNRITAVTPLHGTAIDLAADRGSVWVATVPDDVVFRLSPDDGSVLATFPAGDGPSTLSAAGGVWIADTTAREIVRLAPDGTRERLPTGGTPWAARAHDGLVWASVAAPQPVASAAGSGTLRIPLVADAIGDADPATTGGPVFDQLAYSTCVHLLSHPDAAGAEGRSLVPEAAVAMPAVSADGRTYRFRVRRGFRFSPPSGEEVTAETFRHTIERTLSPRLAPGDGPNPFGAVLADVEGATAYAAGRAPHISGITVRGDTLTVRLTRPAGDLPARLGLSRFCPVPIGTPPVEGGGSATPIPMAGPYDVAATGDGQTVLERNPNYTGDRPRRPERIVYTQGGTATGAVARVRRGDADYVTADLLGYDPGGPLAPGGAIDRSYGPGSRAGRAGRPRYVVGPAPLIDGIAFNTRRPLFRDAAMRRAVAYALDRTALAAVYGERPTDRLIPPLVSGRDENIAHPDRPDLATARRLAGGGRHTAGLYLCGDPIGARIAGIIRANLAPIGIDVHTDQSLGCLNGPEPRRLAAADMQLFSHIDGAVDPRPFIDVALGDPYTAPGYWRPGSLGPRFAEARALSGAARTTAYLGLEEILVRDAAPLAVYGAAVEPAFFSERVGCRITQGALGMADLGALCLG